jgi:two-component system sensor histidine kinase/response regulator
MQRNTKILVVDDREINRYIRGETLRKAGYHVVETSTGSETLKRCLQDEPDLVLLDIHLPDISGFEVCRRIKQDAKTASIMVIQISASTLEMKDQVRGLDGGADDFLLEPIEPELLVARVKSLLRLRSVEERLRRSNNDLAQFAYVASHDLQAPMRAVLVSAQMLQRDYRSKLDERGTTFLDHIIAGGQRMTDLIRDLLEYSTVSSLVSTEEYQAIEMSRIVIETKEWLKDRLEETRAEITCSDLPVIRGPRVRVSQLMRNLIENAVKYRREAVEPRVRISAERGDHEWIFSVADNGEGFDPSFAESIFGVFRRLHGADIGGSGVGLAICRTVVERAGGKIWAEGKPGEGATFYFTWPA